ncbi:MAG: response regulator [Gelidibacter sp.]|nr:response regulator [Gelidibacter sp.]
MIAQKKLEFEHSLLIIDDEVEITKSLYRQFRRKYNVHIATSADEALPIMEKERIQVVLSDQRMPGMTGIDFFAKIKDKYPDALKLILTGYSDIEAVIGAINEGQIFRYLTKPWNNVELEVAINEAFEKYELITNNRRLMNQLQEANLFLEKKVAERTKELEKSNVKLTTLNIEKNKYVGIVAHDLRNPIGLALSFSDLIISDHLSLSQAEQLRFLKIINEKCSFALNLIEGFLDTSKIESGILDLNFKAYNYCKFVQECIEHNKLFAQKKSQEIIFHCECPKAMLVFDKNKMEQVLNNLISNAIKYSHSNKKIWVNILQKDNNIVTQVKDEGQGIPKDELESIFRVFETGTVKATNKEKSTGLGLAIVKKIIEVHHGSIALESTPNIGSVFTFTLPII